MLSFFIKDELPFSTTVSFLTADSFVTELVSPISIKAINVEVHKNRIPPQRTADNFFPFL